MFVFETERDKARAGEGQREGDTESEAGSRLSAISTEPDTGLELTSCEIMTWDKVGCSTNWATQAPPRNFFNVYFWERERETDRVWAGEEQREGDTESKAGSRLWAVSTEPDVRLELTNCEIMTWAEVGQLMDWATQAPLIIEFYNGTVHVFFWYSFSQRSHM